jgi:hypothetical protein
MIDLDVVSIVIILLTYSLDLMQQRRTINNCLLKQSCKYEEVWANFSSAASDLENKLKEL